VCCGSGCFAGGAAVEAGGGVVAHRWRLQTVMLLLQAVKKRLMFFPSPPFSSSFSAAFPFPFCSDLDGVSFQDLTSSRVSIVFLNPHGPLSFTSHCPS